MFCSKCGKLLKGTESFCTECGAPVVKVPAQQEIAGVAVEKPQPRQQTSLDPQYAQPKPQTSLDPQYAQPKPQTSLDPQYAQPKPQTSLDPQYVQPQAQSIAGHMEAVENDDGSGRSKKTVWIIVAAVLAAFLLVIGLALGAYFLLGVNPDSWDESDRHSDAYSRDEADEDEQEDEVDAPADEEVIRTEPTAVPTEDPMELAFREARDYCTSLISQGDFDGAIAYLEEQKLAMPEDNRYDGLIEECRIQRKNNLLDSAEMLAAAHLYREAIQIMDEAWDTYQDAEYYSLAAEYRMAFGKYSNTVMAAGKYNTALLDGGSLYVVGDSGYGELSANSWTDVTEVSLGDRYVMALHSDGTVALTGEYTTNMYARDPGWENIVAISAGDTHCVGLTSNGRLVSLGYNGHGQTNVDAIMQAAGSSKIVAISAGYTHTVALLEDGTALACGDNSKGACNVGAWTDVAVIVTGSEYTAALMTDGTVKITGQYAEMVDTSGWTDIVALAAGDYFLVGLKADGTMVAGQLTKNYDYAAEGQLNVSGLSNIVHIVAGYNHVVAMDSSGYLYCLGTKAKGACDVAGMHMAVN